MTDDSYPELDMGKRYNQTGAVTLNDGNGCDMSSKSGDSLF